MNPSWLTGTMPKEMFEAEHAAAQSPGNVDKRQAPGAGSRGLIPAIPQARSPPRGPGPFCIPVSGNDDSGRTWIGRGIVMPSNRSVEYAFRRADPLRIRIRPARRPALRPGPIARSGPGRRRRNPPSLRQLGRSAGGGPGRAGPAVGAPEGHDGLDARPGVGPAAHGPRRQRVRPRLRAERRRLHGLRPQSLRPGQGRRLPGGMAAGPDPRSPDPGGVPGLAAGVAARRDRAICPWSPSPCASC